MKQNIGNTDRIVRIALAVLLTVGAWMAGFGSIGFCPLYLPFGFSTKSRPASN